MTEFLSRLLDLSDRGEVVRLWFHLADLWPLWALLAIVGGIVLAAYLCYRSTAVRWPRL